MPTPTIYEVATRAGVSISTVSLAINHPGRVSSATRSRILEIADEVGFVPKERAVARAKAGVGRIAVVAPFTSYPSYAERLAGVLSEISGDGTQIVVFDHEDVATSRSPLLETLPVRGHVDGIIIMGVPVEEAVIDRLAGRLPAVLVDQRDDRLPSVWIDDFAGGQLVGARLWAWGHRRVVFVRETEVSFLSDSPSQLRSNGLRSVLGDAEVREVVVSRTPHAGTDALEGAFADPLWTPTAVFCNRDLVALSVVDALRASGRRVFEDVSVVGFDDDAAAAATSLTTVVNPLRESGQRAAQIVRRMMSSPSEPAEQVELPLMFRDRSTAGPAPS